MAKPEWTVRPKMYSTMFYYWQRPTIQGLSGTAALQQTLWFGVRHHLGTTNWQFPAARALTTRCNIFGSRNDNNSDDPCDDVEDEQ